MSDLSKTIPKKSNPAFSYSGNPYDYTRVGNVAQADINPWQLDAGFSLKNWAAYALSREKNLSLPDSLAEKLEKLQASLHDLNSGRLLQKCRIMLELEAQAQPPVPFRDFFRTGHELDERHWRRISGLPVVLTAFKEVMKGNAEIRPESPAPHNGHRLGLIAETTAGAFSVLWDSDGRCMMTKAARESEGRSAPQAKQPKEIQIH